MNYLEYYELSQEPFSNAPVSRFYYSSAQHAQALMRLTHAVSGMKGLAVLVGDIGAGKTTLARRMLDALPEEEYEAALLVIIHSGITASWLLKRIALQLGVESPADEKLALLSQLYQRLVRIYEQGKKAVVLIDEAQMLATREIMEEFRGLLNLEVPERKLLSFVFFGLPEIERNLKLDPPLAQRVALKYRLEPLSAEATEAYVRHRLRLAGAARVPFTAGALARIHAYTRGTPRLINTLCDNALFEGFVARARELDERFVDRVARDLGIERLPADRASGGAPRAARPRRDRSLPRVAEVAGPHAWRSRAPRWRIEQVKKRTLALAFLVLVVALVGGTIAVLRTRWAADRICALAAARVERATGLSARGLGVPDPAARARARGGGRPARDRGRADLHRRRARGAARAHPGARAPAPGERAAPRPPRLCAPRRAGGAVGGGSKAVCPPPILSRFEIRDLDVEAGALDVALSGGRRVVVDRVDVRSRPPARTLRALGAAFRRARVENRCGADPASRARAARSP